MTEAVEGKGVLVHTQAGSDSLCGLRESYPIHIIQDRYSGCYSKGAWLAIAGADEPGRTDALEDGPNGGDCDAMEFWMNPPSWIAVGATPDQALAALPASPGTTGDDPLRMNQNPSIPEINGMMLEALKEAKGIVDAAALTDDQDGTPSPDQDALVSVRTKINAAIAAASPPALNGAPA